MPIKTDEEIAREVHGRLNLHTTDLCELDFALVAAGRKAQCKADAEMLRAEAERVKHTSHADGLGMGWQALENRLLEIAAEIRRAGEGE